MKDWLGTNRLAPSWVLSLVLHASLIWFALWLAPIWERPPVGDADEPARQIGIFVKTEGPLVEPQEGTSEDTETPSDDTANPLASDPLTPPSAVPENLSNVPPLPQASEIPAIGPGNAAANSGLPDPRELVKPSKSGTGGTGTKPGGGLPGASFMGIKDEGTRVVYVVDSSGSMYQHRAMYAAKAALTASLQNLDAAQQFQIIFYNESPRLMSLKSAPKKQLYFATDVNKNAARQFINGINPDLGTQHLDAIKLGLSLGPEVMFVLTDSGDPVLTPRELDEIRQRNRGRTRIHCIEFGVGKELAGETGNFLKKLARQNEGTHRYVDVTEFSRK